MSAAVSFPAPTPSRPKRAWHHWTEREDNVIRMHWGIRPATQIASEIDRAPKAVYRRGTELGLGAGAPQGFEYESHAAARAGYARGTFRRILQWANVHIRPAASLPGSVGHDKIVEPQDVDRAVAAWCACEDLEQAAARHGYSPCTIRLWLQEAASRGEIELPARARRKRWRIARSVIDAVVAQHAERRTRETGRDAAARVGVSWNTLRAWLAEAGAVRPSPSAIDSAEVDRIVAAKRAAGSKAFRNATNNEGATA